MKNLILKILTLICIILISANSAMAAFKLPKYVYTIKNFDNAQKEATLQKKPLIFLYSDKDSTCPLCDGASNDIIYSFDKVAVIIYVSSVDRESLPPIVNNAINLPEAGKYIPITIITDHELQNVISIIPYQKQNRISLINEAKKKIKANNNL